MERTQVPERWGALWVVRDAITEALAVVIGIVLAPVAAVSRARARSQSQDTVRAVRREVAQHRALLRLEARRASDLLAEHLAALQRLEDRYVQGHYRTPADAERAYALLELSRRALLVRARADATRLGADLDDGRGPLNEQTGWSEPGRMSA